VVPYPLALMISIDQYSGVTYRLSQPGFINRIIIIIGTTEWPFLHENLTAIGQPKTALIQVLVVIGRTSPHDKNKIILLPAAFEYSGTQVPE